MGLACGVKQPRSQTLPIQNHLRHLLWHDQSAGCLLTLPGEWHQVDNPAGAGMCQVEGGKALPVAVCMAPFIVMDQRMVWGNDAACASIHHSSAICR